jgi:lambda family phage portal protein
MSAFENLIAAVSPAAALNREAARVRLEALRRYEGASRGRRTDGWRTSGTSADAAAAPGLKMLRDRSRDLVRNNPYASKAVQVIVSNTIGTGIVAQARAQRSRRRSQQFTDLWLNWALDSRQCDYDGRADFYGLQALAMRCIVESGEVLIRRRTSSGQRVPLQLQIMEPDFIDTTKDVALADGGLIKQGIEYDGSGRRVAYWLYAEHPGEQHLRMTDFLSSRVPAEEIIHVYRQDRPHQTRGVPWASPIIIRLRDFDDYSDAQLLKQKISACFTAFAVDTESPEGGADMPFDKLEPGAVEILPPGKDIRFANPPTVGEFDKISRQYLLQIAAGFGVTYEALTGDLTNTNFSSGRMGWLEFQRNIEAWRWQMLVPQMLNPVWQWFSNAATVNGARMEGITAQWTPPRRELIDPSKEIAATIKAVRGGLITLSEAIREYGYDPEEVMLEMQQDNERLDALGLVLDSDPRKMSGAGNLQQQGADQATEAALRALTDDLQRR